MHLHPAKIPPLLLVLLAAMAAGIPVFAQGAPVLELTDFSGVWAERVHEDSYERSGGPPLGDYQGIPLNDAGRRKALLDEQRQRGVQHLVGPRFGASPEFRSPLCCEFRHVAAPTDWSVRYVITDWSVSCKRILPSGLDEAG